MAFVKQLEAATSEALLEPDLPKNLRCVDIIRSGDVTPNEAFKAIVRRIGHKNPNIQLLALEVLEMVVKNCGSEIQALVAQDKFMKTMRALLKSDSPKVRDKTLELIQLWAHAFQNVPEYKVVPDTYNALRMEGHRFPAFEPQSSAMFDVERPPEWKQGNACFHCRSKFTITNRRHHCRNCGEIFCQKCSAKTSTLQKFGIEKPVRVCDPCYDKLKSGGTSGQKPEADMADLSELDQMRQLALQMQDLSPEEQVARIEAMDAMRPKSNQTQGDEQERERKRREAELKEKEEMELALALSLSEAESKPTQPSYSQPRSSLYPTMQHEPSAPPASSGLYENLHHHDEQEDSMSRYLRRSQSSSSQKQKSSQQKKKKKKSQKDNESQVQSQQEPQYEEQELVQEQLQEGFETDKLDYSVSLPVASNCDEFISNFRTMLSRFEQKIQRVLVRGGDPRRDPGLQHAQKEVMNLHPQLMATMDELEDQNERLTQLHTKHEEAIKMREGYDVARQDHLARVEQMRKEQELLERMQLEQRMQLLKQQEMEKQNEMMRREAEMRQAQEMERMRIRQSEIQAQEQMRTMMHGSSNAVPGQHMPGQQIPGQMQTMSAQYSVPPQQQQQYVPQQGTSPGPDQYQQTQSTNPSSQYQHVSSPVNVPNASRVGQTFQPSSPQTNPSYHSPRDVGLSSSPRYQPNPPPPMTYSQPPEQQRMYSGTQYDPRQGMQAGPGQAHQVTQPNSSQYQPSGSNFQPPGPGPNQSQYRAPQQQVNQYPPQQYQSMPPQEIQSQYPPGYTPQQAPQPTPATGEKPLIDL